MTRLAVLGSPIGHSKSPALHEAVFRTLGLDWQYDAIDVTPDALAGFLDSRTPDWLGLSLTMPLKKDVLPLLDEVDELVRLTGAANTVVFDGGRRLGFNTDVYGISEAFRSAGVSSLSTVQILGAGATAAAAMAAVATLGATRVAVATRSPERHSELVAVADTLGIDAELTTLDRLADGLAVDAIISTVPGSAELAIAFAERVRREAVLFDVAYDPWPTPLAASWQDAGGLVISGLSMLIYQALIQERIFVNGTPEKPLDLERQALAAMRSAVGLQS